METHILFSTRERAKILREAVYSIKPLTVAKLAKKLQLSKSVVSKFLGMLTKEKIVRRKGAGYVVVESPQTVAVRLLFNISSFDRALFSYPFVKAVGIYGSWAKGRNTVDSDIDMWIKVGRAGTADLAALQHRLMKIFPKIKILFIDEEKVEHIKVKNPLFFHSLVFGSIAIYGDLDEIYK